MPAYTCQQCKSFIGKLPGQKQKANCSLLRARLTKSVIVLVFFYTLKKKQYNNLKFECQELLTLG